MNVLAFDKAKNCGVKILKTVAVLAIALALGYTGYTGASAKVQSEINAAVSQTLSQSQADATLAMRGMKMFDLDNLPRR